MKRQTDRNKMASAGMTTKSPEEIVAMLRIVQCYMPDILTNYNFPNPNDPAVGEEVPTPKFFVNVKIVEDGDIQKTPSIFVKGKIIANILGHMPEGSDNVDGSSRLVLKSMKDVNKLETCKNIKLNDITYHIKAHADKKMNQGRGIIFMKSLNECDETEILEGLKAQGVIEVYPFKRMMDNGKGGKELMKTGTYKLTFNTNVVPRELSVQYAKCKVNMYYDNPMYCDNCGQFAHTQKRCTAEKRCKKCNQKDHGDSECVAPPSCACCSGQHEINPKACPAYTFEKNCIRYATLAQIPVSTARRFALNQIKSYLIEASSETNIAKLLKEDKMPEKPKAQWYREPSEMTVLNSKPMRKIVREFATGKNYLDTELHTNRPAPKSTSINPHLRAIANIGNRSMTNYNDMDMFDTTTMFDDDMNGTADFESPQNTKKFKSK